MIYHQQSRIPVVFCGTTVNAYLEIKKVFKNKMKIEIK
jgi:hypothetical protein